MSWCEQAVIIPGGFTITFTNTNEMSQIQVPNFYQSSQILGIKAINGSIDNFPIVSAIIPPQYAAGILTNAQLTFTSSSNTDKSTYALSWINMVAQGYKQC